MSLEAQGIELDEGTSSNSQTCAYEPCIQLLPLPRALFRSIPMGNKKQRGLGYSVRRVR